MTPLYGWTSCGPCSKKLPEHDRCVGEFSFADGLTGKPITHPYRVFCSCPCGLPPPR